MQPPKKRHGRMVMARSRPVKSETKGRNDDGNDGNNDDELRFLS